MPTAQLDDLELSFTIPDDADGLLETLENSAKMTEIMERGGSDGLAQFNALFAKAQAEKDKGEITDQIGVQVEQQVAEILRENNHEMNGRLNLSAEALEATLNASAISNMPHYSKTAPGHALHGVFNNTGEYLQSIFNAEQPTNASFLKNRDQLEAKAKQVEGIQAAYSSHIGSSGGFLMPEEFRQQMLRLAMEEAVMRSRATVIPMGAPKLTIPAIHETNRSSTLFGGVSIYWTPEEADSTESEAQFKTVSLEPDTMTGYAEIPNETMADTIAFDAYFNATFPAAMAYEEDYAFLQGSGVGQPVGALNAACKVEVAKESGQAADTIVYNNILKMWARLPGGSMNRAVWLANQDTIPQLGTMALDVGTGGGPIWTFNAQTGLPSTLMGRPIIFTEKVDQVGDVGDITLIDPSFYLIGDLQTMTVSSSEHFKFKSRQTAFSIVSRVDGKPWLNTAITPRHGSSTLSPIVTLAARA